MSLLAVLLAVLLVTALYCVSAYRSAERIPHFNTFALPTHPEAQRNDEHPLVSRCREHTRSATLDHFSWAPKGGFVKFEQRYYVCDEYWKNTEEEKGPIFLYLGNEAGVEKYIKATGFMWESAPEFGAMLVFIEHRYYGKSKPYGESFMDHLEYLSGEQAIADYAEFLFEFQAELGGHNLPVIGFGGSYGGMLGAWMRMKYPHALHGVIASSAPIWSFMGEVPPVDPNYFDKIKTYAASKLAGPGGKCVENIKRTWDTIFQVAIDIFTPGHGPAALKKALGFCPDMPIRFRRDLYLIMHWIDHAITRMAEGSYNFPSAYMTDDVSPLPPYPLREGCSYLADDLHGIELLEGVGKLAAIFYNVSKDVECFTLSRDLSEEDTEINTLWGYQYCTEIFQMFGSDGVSDMFWNDPWDPKGTVDYCRGRRGVETRPYWATQQWGGKDISTASNIIFSNGEYDPWSGGGVLYNVSDAVVALIIEEGGHHADLMFEHKEDNESLRAARRFEKESIRRWIKEVREKNKKLFGMTESPAALPVEAVASEPAKESLSDENGMQSTLLEFVHETQRKEAEHKGSRTASIEGSRLGRFARERVLATT